MRWWRWLAVAGLVCSAGGSWAVRAESSEPPPLTEELPALKLLQEIPVGASSAERLEALDRALTMLVQPTPFRGVVLCMRGSVLDQLKRYDEARTAFEQCRQLRPKDAMPVLALAFAAIERKQPVDAALLVIRAANLDPDAVRQVPPAGMQSLFRLLHYAQAHSVRHSLIDTLVRTGWARDNAKTFSPLAAVTLRDRLGTGHRAEAVAMLPTILEPQIGVGMLIDRRFATIWPDIEKWAGADLSVQRQAMLDSARAAYETRPGPTEAIAYADTLAETGHRADAIAQLQSFLRSPPPEADAFFRNMAVVKLARYLAEVGRRREGIDLMRTALGGPDSGDPSVANIVPNLAVALLLADDHAGALALLDARTPSAEGVEAPAALGYFVALRACALRGMGRNKAADEALSRVETIYGNNKDALEIAIACAGTPDARAAFWIAQARNPETRTGALMELAAVRYREMHGIHSNPLTGRALSATSTRADAAAVYDELARGLPPQFGPAAIGYLDPTE